MRTLRLRQGCPYSDRYYHWQKDEMNIKAKGLFCNCGKPMFAKRLCKPCYGLFWRENNREHNLQLQADWRAAHPNYGSESYIANKEKAATANTRMAQVNKKRTRITNRLL